jgi:hypothetical protein
VVVLEVVVVQEVVVQEADWGVAVALAEAWEPVLGATLEQATTMALLEEVDWAKESATVEASIEDHIGVLAAILAYVEVAEWARALVLAAVLVLAVAPVERVTILVSVLAVAGEIMVGNTMVEATMVEKLSS